MNQYQQWTRAELRALVRRELMDTGTRWWSDAELDMYADDWLNEMQQEFEFVWGTWTETTALSTVNLGTFNPPVHRLDAIYWMGTWT